MTSTSERPSPPGETIVVKLGGAEGVQREAVCEDIAGLTALGLRVVVVHGGSAEANHLGEALGRPPRFVTSPSGYTSRYTDRPTLEIFLMAVNGKLNSLLVEDLQTRGVNAFGLSGVDGRLIEAQRKATIRIVENGRQKVLRDDYTGKIRSVAVSLLATLLEGGYVPVIAPLAVSERGEALNVDADRAAAMVAGALGAQTLVLLTAVAGLMRSFPDESTVIASLTRSQIETAMPFAQGRMKKKLLGAREALDRGVGRVIIADGRRAKPVSLALKGQGTRIDPSGINQVI